MYFNKKTYFSSILILCMLFLMWPRVLSAATAKNKYYKAEACYKKLRHNPKKQKYRDKWLGCIKKFEAVYRHDPKGPWAAAGLYMSGQLYQELYKRSFKTSDRKTATAIYDRIIAEFPKSKYRQKAEYALGHVSYKKTPKRASKKKTPKKDVTRVEEDSIEAEIEKLTSTPLPVKTDLKGSLDKEAKVLGLRYWSNPSYTRVVIDADNEVSYTHRLLKKDVSIKKPQRLYIDLNSSRLAKDITKVVPINDNLLIDARAGQYASNRVRVVVDIKSFETYKIFSLKNPFRIVIDVWGTVDKPVLPPIRTDQKDKKIPPGALAKQLALGVSRIVIDPGHGGRDYGAPGYLRGVHEKNVVLKLARRLAKKIRKELGCEVIMTRNGDRNLTLEERTAIANTKNADLFISIHTNAARDKRAYGIETFFLNLATDNDAILVAARENATSTKNISDLETILSDLMQNAKINESSRLAVHVQKSMHRHLKKNYSRIRNKGVKQAPFYVLLGAQMPAILIETSFISNPRECKRLNNTGYQDQMSEAIVKGIKEYIKDTNPTALMEENPDPVSKRYGG
ncbi:MAG: N-acetylmuramoyl-L-alanine amidase [Desulfobacteraceae bacterium]|nr:N-acetylmuramoyl-L-alanine amidase [Desulfobacteraceae bacterium]MDH3721200.1 N-acetylmuramoyl-L-alanine amidase [Desulfobacteraceae bacterium]MDH3836402.1 N-acetylmuramoyl-L-alanine amidase [Desulfobacteraceae bacterium]MDH3874226.1 N-acetylmuramoyl-L-alanine amidase [Desulfobacteraceae bacterium]MDH3880301.1 N-acetylmuramoyl-L-alanine amidase [Desulfobacteraceae bacterium]